MRTEANGPADCLVSEMLRFADGNRILRGFRAIALLSAFSGWFSTILVDLPNEEMERLSGEA